MVKRKVLISRTRVTQDTWKEFKKLAKKLGTTRDALLDLAIFAMIAYYKERSANDVQNENDS
jgi:hypothetical protein